MNTTGVEQQLKYRHSVTMWHFTVRWIAKRSLRWFYRDVLIAGSERIPASGPVVLVANHPNDLPDVLIGYLSTPRKVRYIATISAATNAISRATYRGLGVIAVTRVRDARKLLREGASALEINRLAYEQVVSGLEAGDVIGAFPEGGVNTGSGIAPFRSGLAQMILQCLNNGAIQSITVVPIGIQYEHPSIPRSDVVALCGNPFVVSSGSAADLPNREQVQQLTAKLRESLLTVAPNACSELAEEGGNQMAAVAGALRADSPVDALLQRAVEASGIQLFVNRIAELDQLDSSAVVGAAKNIGRVVQELGGRSGSAEDTYLLASALRNAPFSGKLSGFRLGLLALPAMFGYVVHMLPRKLIWRIAKRSAENRSHVVARALLPGLYIVVFWLLLISAAASSLMRLADWSFLLSVSVFVLLIMLGDISLTWRKGFAQLRYMRRTRAALRNNETLVATLRSDFSVVQEWLLESDTKRVSTPETVRVIS